MSWTFTQSVNPSGYGLFSIHLWTNDPGNPWDVTFFRDVPTQITSMVFADPFGDATATLFFPQVTGFDGPSGSTPWLKEFVNVDIRWVPATATPIGEGETLVLNPMTQKLDLYLHTSLAEPIWEGFCVAIEPSQTGTSMQCQGALYQLDRYYAKPLNPQRPKTVESMIARYFDPRRRGLWTKPLRIDWPDDWNIQYDQAAYESFAAQGIRYVPTDINTGGNILIGFDGPTPIYDPDPNWTGYVTRNTGGWEKALTGYIQSQLGILFAEPDIGDPVLSKGDQWTVTKEAGRQPVLKVRNQNAEPTLVAWYGQPGVSVRLTRDGNVVSNVVFGRGTGIDGTQWDQRVYPGYTWNTFQPLSWDDNTYRGIESGFPLSDLYDGYDANYERANGINVIERYASNFPSGIELGDATQITANWIERDKNPGWMGNIDIQTDLVDPLGTPVSKWKIKAGDVIWLKGWYGTGASQVKGTNIFHVSSVSMNPMEGTISLTVDSKFRDLLTVEEAMAAGRDSLSVIKSLQVGKRSAMIDDLVVPWSNSQGSGFIPQQSKDFTKVDLVFPYTGTTTTAGQRPKDIFKDDWLPQGSGKPVQNDVVKASGNYPNNVPLRQTVKNGTNDYTGEPYTPLYVPIHAGANNRSLRWATVPVLMAQAGKISRAEFCAYDEDGEIAPIEFHVSFYGKPTMNISDMPRDDSGSGPGQYAALWDGAFENINLETGLPYPVPPGGGREPHQAPAYFYIGWGTYERPAGYSPGMKQSATGTDVTPTGKLVDGANWDFNFVDNPDFPKTGYWADGRPITSSAVTGCVAIYAQIPSWYSGALKAKYDWVYFVGRFYRDYTVNG